MLGRIIPRNVQALVGTVSTILGEERPLRYAQPTPYTLSIRVQHSNLLSKIVRNMSVEEVPL